MMISKRNACVVRAGTNSWPRRADNPHFKKCFEDSTLWTEKRTPSATALPWCVVKDEQEEAPRLPAVEPVCNGWLGLKIRGYPSPGL